MAANGVFAVIRVMGRSRETRCTLLSLGRMRDVQRLAVWILYTPSLHGCRDHTIEWQAARGYLDQAGKAIDLPAMLEEAGLTQARVVEDSIRTGANESAGRALRLYRHFAPAFPWYLWIENDLLFRPDWLVRTLAVYTAAAQQVKVGIVTPIRRQASHYKLADPGDNAPYLTQGRVPGPCWLLPRNVALMIPPTHRIWREESKWDLVVSKWLEQRGYTHTCPKQSTVQHIGRKGYTHDDKKWLKDRGGIGFEPTPEIMDLWREFNWDAEADDRSAG